MLAIFKKGFVNPPKELISPASIKGSLSQKPILPNEILNNFLSSHSNNGFSMGFAEKALIAYSPPQNPFSIHNRMFCGVDNIYCIFLGALNNLPALLRQYGLSKGTNEAAFVVEAYRTLRDRGPYPADQVLRDMDGKFGFVVYDAKDGSVFVSLGGDEEGVKLYWGIGGDGCVVISDNLEVIKGSCFKSFAPFPAGCMYHNEHGLMSFEQPLKKMKAMPRIDSEGILCGSNFKVDSTISSSKNNMTRVGSEANCAIWRSQT